MILKWFEIAWTGSIPSSACWGTKSSLLSPGLRVLSFLSSRLQKISPLLFVLRLTNSLVSERFLSNSFEELRIGSPSCKSTAWGTKRGTWKC